MTFAPSDNADEAAPLAPEGFTGLNISQGKTEIIRAILFKNQSHEPVNKRHRNYEHQY
jgi:hypothetical protein